LLADPRKAKKKLGFEARTDFKEGLKRTIEWYMKTYAQQQNKK